MFSLKALLAALVSLTLISCSTAGGDSEASLQAVVTNAQNPNDSETALEQSNPSQESPPGTTVSSSNTGTVVLPGEPTANQDNAAKDGVPGTAAPAPQTDPDPTGYETFRVQTYTDAHQLGRASLGEGFIGEFILEFSPGFDPEKAVRLSADIENAFKPWQSLTRSHGIKVIVADENGSEFYLDQIPDDSNCPGTPGGRGFDAPRPGFHMGFGCWNPFGDFIMYFGLHSADDGWGTFFLHHEVSHLAQNGIAPAHTGDQPCFYSEGEAQFFGKALTASPPKVGEPHWAFYSLWQIAQKHKLSTIDDWVTFLVSRESRDGDACWEDQFNYEVGWIMVERAYGEFGAAKWDLWRASLVDGDWRVSFRRIFGVEPADWYRDSLVPYLKHWCKC